jgi:hypothetical protein
VLGERCGDLEETAPRSRGHLGGVIDDATRTKVPVEGHLDDDLSLAREV